MYFKFPTLILTSFVILLQKLHEEGEEDRVNPTANISRDGFKLRPCMLLQPNEGNAKGFPG